jgi:hypothetical protein
MKHYIEISGRATAKTFRLIQKINSFLAEHPGEKAALITPHIRQWSRIKDKISPDLVGALDCFTLESINNITNSSHSHLFFDEFDSIGLSIYFVKNMVERRVPFTVFSGVSKQREVTRLDPNDPLVYLIKENNGLYITGTGVATNFTDPIITNDLISNISTEVYEREYLATLFYRENPNKEAASIYDVIDEMAQSRDSLGEFPYLVFDYLKDYPFKSFGEKVEKIRDIACLAKYGKYSVEDAVNLVLNKK